MSVIEYVAKPQQKPKPPANGNPGVVPPWFQNVVRDGGCSGGGGIVPPDLLPPYFTILPTPWPPDRDDSEDGFVTFRCDEAPIT